jgi:hypothetical protein
MIDDSNGLDISENAYQWAKENKKNIVKELVKDVNPVDSPTSFFMAGSPGAGKTEYSKSFIQDLDNSFQNVFGANYSILRIDIDDIRPLCPGYNGKNSSLFQRATVLIANKLHDFALKNNLNFLFDGTFANEEKAINNIERSIKKDRKVQIFYLYQDPIRAWELTQARENKDGRVVPMDVFIDDFFKAKEVVDKIKNKFKEVAVDLIIRDYSDNKTTVFFNIDNIDKYLKLSYNRYTLKNALKRV